MSTTNPEATAALGINSLTYRDPTGEAVVRRLMPGDYAITDSSGFTLWIDAANLAPVLTLYNFQMTRTGKNIRGRLKRRRG
ncbi:hypothetical protein QCD70_05495 [Agreia sp. PsM10]|uniref:hypothetical protein n=1 Tax=Agreia sp. PsM10 TaxID=3030533 RepID=UPI00263A43BE|nr:hypothetical protein [Agreia sp. PsM10]MDN4639694.1 hypothetical protein [Agreia sp. PsM10]